MEYTIKEKKSSWIFLGCKNSKDEIENSKKEAYSKLSLRVKIPGFRKGKAPYEIGIRYVGEDRIIEEAVELMADKDLDEILEKEKISPLGHPEIKVEKIDNDNFVFTCKIEFLPQIDFDPDEKVHLKFIQNVSEEEVEQKINEIRDSFTELQPKDEEITKGDVVEISVHYEGHEPQNLTIEAGKDKVIGDFETQILGKKKGDSFTVMSDSTEVHFDVISAKKKIIPEINDELAREADFENLGAMKEKIRSQLSENKKLQFEEGRGREGLKNIAEKLEAELPGKFVEQEVEERIDNLKERYLKIGKKIDEVLKEENKDMEGFKKEVRNVIENEIKEDLILREIIKKKELSVTEDEIKSEFERIALDQGVDTAKVGLSEDLSRAIRSELYRSKAISILKENVIIDSGGD